MKRKEILQKAEACVCGEREEDYGTPEDNFTLIGDLWSVYVFGAHKELGEMTEPLQFTSKDVAMMMALLKVARIATGSSPDSFVDLAGYAACGGEIVTGRNNAPASLSKEAPKPLTVEELRHLANGLMSVCIVHDCTGKYSDSSAVIDRRDGRLIAVYGDAEPLDISDYGTKWVAYKYEDKERLK